jgi:hypothetical protein
MGRRKIEIVRVKDPAVRQVTFSKRRTGLFNKANEVAILTGAEIAIIVFSPGNKPYSFGHPSVDAIASNFLEEKPNLNHVLGTISSNIEDLNQQLQEVLGELDEAEKEAKVHDEIIKKYKAIQFTQFNELKDSFIEFKGMIKSRICDLYISQCMILLAREPVIGIKNQSTGEK